MQGQFEMMVNACGQKDWQRLVCRLAASFSLGSNCLMAPHRDAKTNDAVGLTQRLRLNKSDVAASYDPSTTSIEFRNFACFKRSIVGARLKVQANDHSSCATVYVDIWRDVVELRR